MLRNGQKVGCERAGWTTVRYLMLGGSDQTVETQNRNDGVERIRLFSEKPRGFIPQPRYSLTSVPQV